jgi:hypothetical protein
MLSLVNSGTPRCFVHVIDDGSDEDVSDRSIMFNDMIERKLIHRYDKLDKSIGFCRVREILADSFLKVNRFHYWFHTDDDMLYGEHVVETSYHDYNTHMQGKGLLHIFPNPWCQPKRPFRGPLAEVPKAGGCVFLLSKNTLKNSYGNPYKDQTDGEGANARFWSNLKSNGFSTSINVVDPYEIQHTGNVNSVIFGQKPQWEPLWHKRFDTGQIVDVSGHSIHLLREALRLKTFDQYVKSSNSRYPIKLNFGDK